MDWNTIAAIVTSLSTIVLACLTYKYVRLTHQILERYSDPCVIVTVIHDDSRPTILQIVIKNIGTGLAHDIRFEFSRPLPANEAEIMSDGPLISGIPALGPGETRKIDWGQHGGLIKNVGDETITVTSFFKKNGKEMPSVASYLDVKSFWGTSIPEQPLPKIASQIEKIAKEISHLASGFHKLQVIVVDMSSKNKQDNSST